MELILLPLLLLAGLFTLMDGGSDEAGGTSGSGDGDEPLEGTGDDRIAGGSGDDLLTLADQSTGWGGAGDDTLIASDEATAYGRAGDDSLTGSDNATIMGGEGDDTLIASGEAYALGGDGNDVLFAQDDAAAQGGDGNDTLTASEDGRIAGGAGNDVLIYQDIGRVASSEDGADIYVLDHAAGGAALNFEYGSRDASDQIAIHLGTNDLSNFKFSTESGTADGSDGPDGDFTEITITETLADGTTQNSSLFIRGVYGYGLRNIVLYGEDIGDVVDWKEYFGENDTLQATGSETVYGGIGNDIIQTSMTAVGYGGDGDDRINSFVESTVYGDAGNDSITASGNTTGYGGTGDDRLSGGWNDTVHGGDGNDTLSVANTSEGYGDAGNDLIQVFGTGVAYGGAGDDDMSTGVDGAGQAPRLYGGEGNDHLASSAADALLYGGVGNDVMTGYAGTLLGEGGDDLIYADGNVVGEGGAGNDSLSADGVSTIRGGDGNDALWIAENSQGFGDAGNDLFLHTSGFGGVLNEGVATVTGGSGSDRFIMADLRGNGVNAEIEEFTREMIITDFDPATDQIGLLSSQASPSNVTVTTEFDSASNSTVVTVVREGGVFASPDDTLTAIFRLQGQTTFDVANLLFMSEDEIPPFWQDEEPS